LFLDKTPIVGMQFVTFRWQTLLVLVATQQQEVPAPCKQLSIHPPPPRNNHQRARFADSLKRALSACTLGLLLSACGGGDWSSSESAQAEDGKARALSGTFGATYSPLAVEGASFTVVGTRTVRYGSGTSWVIKSVTGTGQCTNAFFGFDPLYGVVKTCEIRDIVTPPPTGTWTQVAVEGGSFTTVGTQTVRYGSGNSWIEKSVTGTGQCGVAFFGSDPLYGVLKRCEVLNPAAPPLATWTQVAVEGGSFTTVGTQTVRYGSGNSWIEKSVTGTGQCGVAFFGSDPLYGVLKRCEVLSATAPPVATWTQVAVEGGSFTTVGTQTVRYGSGNSWIEKSVTGTGQCGVAFFGSDPLYGVLKRCEVLLITAPPVATWTQVAVEGGSFTTVGTQTVRYGSGNTWIEKSVTGTGQCGVAFFGSDPLYGVLKRCEVRASTSVTPVAPSIVTAPLSQTVASGQNGLFVVAASGSDPLTYQWFKNGTAIAGATGSDVLVLANAADVGGTYQITVQVSNSAGSVTSAAAVMSIALPPPNTGGTLITAAEGGEVLGGSTGEEASLYVAPGALSANTTILLTTEPLAPSSLPAGVTAMSDIVEIKPAGLVFLKPVSLTVQVKQNVPVNTALAVLKLDASNTVLGEIRRTALSYKPAQAATKVGGRMAATAFNLPSSLSCFDRQFVDSGRDFTLSAITAAVRTVLVAVPESMCSTFAVHPPLPVPRDTMEACSDESQFGGVRGLTPPGISEDESSTINRHVNCRKGRAVQQPIYVDLYKNADGTATRIAPASALPGETSWSQVGRADIEYQLSMFGPSNVLSKILRYRARVTKFEEEALYTGPKKRPDIFLRPSLEGTYCYSAATDGISQPVTSACKFGTPGAVQVRMSGEWSEWAETAIRFEWRQKMDPQDLSTMLDVASFYVVLDTFQARIEGADPSFLTAGGGYPEQVYGAMGYTPLLRCDRGLAKVKTEGCVFSDAAAVYWLPRADSRVQEAAEHIFEAQNNPDPEKRSLGKFLLKEGSKGFAEGERSGNALQRFKNSDAYGKPNNVAACSRDRSTSLIKIPPVRSSSTCSPNQAGCSCDEFPFNATWQGAAFEPNRTSVKWINETQNIKAGGGRLSGFFTRERVLDLSPYPADRATFPPYVAGDNFWVYIQ
jgi:hypothetical protein